MFEPRDCYHLLGFINFICFRPQISLSMEFRTGKQCRERYVNHLDPDMKRSAWTAEENNMIRDMFPTFGTKWSQYISCLPGRSDNAIKNRYHLISRNNFEYCSGMHVIVSLKRASSELSNDECNSDSNEDLYVDEEEVRAEESRKRLLMLVAARNEVDREILQLEKDYSMETVTEREEPCSPSGKDIFACFKVEEPCDEMDLDFNFDFDWTDPDTPVAILQTRVIKRSG